MVHQSDAWICCRGFKRLLSFWNSLEPTYHSDRFGKGIIMWTDTMLSVLTSCCCLTGKWTWQLLQWYQYTQKKMWRVVSSHSYEIKPLDMDVEGGDMTFGTPPWPPRQESHLATTFPQNFPKSCSDVWCWKRKNSPKLLVDLDLGVEKNTLLTT